MLIFGLAVPNSSFPTAPQDNRKVDTGTTSDALDNFVVDDGLVGLTKDDWLNDEEMESDAEHPPLAVEEEEEYNPLVMADIDNLELEETPLQVDLPGRNGSVTSADPSTNSAADRAQVSSDGQEGRASFNGATSTDTLALQEGTEGGANVVEHETAYRGESIESGAHEKGSEKEDELTSEEAGISKLKYANQLAAGNGRKLGDEQPSDLLAGNQVLSQEHQLQASENESLTGPPHMVQDAASNVETAQPSTNSSHPDFAESTANSHEVLPHAPTGQPPEAESISEEALGSKTVMRAQPILSDEEYGQAQRSDVGQALPAATQQSPGSPAADTEAAGCQDSDAESNTENAENAENAENFAAQDPFAVDLNESIEDFLADEDEAENVDNNPVNAYAYQEEQDPAGVDLDSPPSPPALQIGNTRTSDQLSKQTSSTGEPIPTEELCRIDASSTTTPPHAEAVTSAQTGRSRPATAKVADIQLSASVESSLSACLAALQQEQAQVPAANNRPISSGRSSHRRHSTQGRRSHVDRDSDHHRPRGERSRRHERRRERDGTVRRRKEDHHRHHRSPS